MTNLFPTLKEKLSCLRQNPGQDCIANFSLAEEMLENIGSTDPVLRDDLIYETFAGWIQADRFSIEQLKLLLDTCLDDSHVFYKIGEEGEDSVFTRTFSLLVVALIIDAHRRNKFLTIEDLREVKDKIIHYLACEKDVRGYVEEKGWAHSTAHAADVLGELAQCDELNSPQDMLDILNTLKEKVVINNSVYITKEDERMARAAVRVLGRKILDGQAIAGWLESFLDIRKIDSHPEDDYLRANVKMFLRSLYFQPLQDPGAGQTKAVIEDVLRRLSRF